VRVVITGSSGFIGQALAHRLSSAGHEVVGLRRGAGPGCWDPEAGTIDIAAVVGADAVVNLAGESVAGRWTAAKKQRILSSRVQGTALVARTAADLGIGVLFSSSGINFYGDRGDETLTEQSGRGSGFLADVAVAWEEATAPAAAGGVRTVMGRTALVLEDHGGSLPRMLVPFRLGVGGPIGSGDQWWSWITLEDEVGAIVHCLEDETVEGPVNLAAPNPVRNRDFVRALGRAMHRPAAIPAPAFALRLLLGTETADNLLLGSARVVPAKLAAAGYQFLHSTVETAFAAILG
jgi:hypothetical protein